MNVPIGAITEINPKGFKLEIEVGFEKSTTSWPWIDPKAKNNSYKFGRSIATLEDNVVVIKYCYFDEIHIVESK